LNIHYERTIEDITNCIEKHGSTDDAYCITCRNRTQYIGSETKCEICNIRISGSEVMSTANYDCCHDCYYYGDIRSKIFNQMEKNRRIKI